MAEDQPKSYFYGNAPPGSPLSYEALQVRRKIAEQLMGKRSPFPNTLGQGLTYFGEKVGDAFTMRDLERQDALYQGQRGAAAGEQGRVARGNVPIQQAPATGTVAPPRPYNSTGLPDPGVTQTAYDDIGEQSPFIAASEPVPTQQDQISPAVATAALTGQVPLPPPRPVRDRSKQLAEMQADPRIMQRLMETTAGELDQGYSQREGQIQFQTAMDRAAARGIPVSQALETYTGRGSRGYYPPEVVPRGARALQTPEQFAAFKENIADPVLRGADPGREQFGFTPTGNASLGVAQRGVESGRYNRYGKLPGRGETFVQQETPQQLALLDEGRVSPRGTPGRSSQDAMGAILAATQQSGAGQPIPFSQATPMGPDEDAQQPQQMAQAQPRNPVIVRPDITTIPPQQKRQFPPLPQAVPVENVDRPPVLRPSPVTDAELYATFKRDQTADPVIRGGWESVIANEQAKRKFIDAARQKENEHLWMQWNANQVYSREARQKAIDAAKAERELEEKTPTGAPASAPVTYDPRLGTPASDQRVGVPRVAPMPEGVVPEQWRKSQEQEIAKASAAYEKALPDFNRSIQLIQETRAHPGYESGLGLSGIVARRTPLTDAYGFGTRVEQLKGKNFLAGYEKLKGSGPVSNIEGAKTEQAQARLDPNQNKGDFDSGLADLEISMREDLEQLQRKMRVPVTAWRLPGDNSSYAPDVGQRRGNMEYLGGNPARKESWRAVQ